MEDILYLDFVFVPHPYDNDTLIIFHISLPMRCIDILPYFYCAIKIVAVLSNQIWASATTATTHPLSTLVETCPSTDENDHKGLILTLLDASLSALTMHLLPDIHFTLLCYINSSSTISLP